MAYLRIGLRKNGFIDSLKEHFKKVTKMLDAMNLVHCQKQLECHQHILKTISFVKIIFIKPFRFVKAHEDVSKNKS